MSFPQNNYYTQPVNTNTNKNYNREISFKNNNSSLVNSSNTQSKTKLNQYNAPLKGSLTKPYSLVPPQMREKSNQYPYENQSTSNNSNIKSNVYNQNNRNTVNNMKNTKIINNNHIIKNVVNNNNNPHVNHSSQLLHSTTNNNNYNNFYPNPNLNNYLSSGSVNTPTNNDPHFIFEKENINSNPTIKLRIKNIETQKGEVITPNSYYNNSRFSNTNNSSNYQMTNNKAAQVEKNSNININSVNNPIRSRETEVVYKYNNDNFPSKNQQYNQLYNNPNISASNNNISKNSDNSNIQIINKKPSNYLSRPISKHFQEEDNYDYLGDDNNEIKEIVDKTKNDSKNNSNNFNIYKRQKEASNNINSNVNENGINNDKDYVINNNSSNRVVSKNTSIVMNNSNSNTKNNNTNLASYYSDGEMKNLNAMSDPFYLIPNKQIIKNASTVKFAANSSNKRNLNNSINNSSQKHYNNLKHNQSNKNNLTHSVINDISSIMHSSYHQKPAVTKSTKSADVYRVKPNLSEIMDFASKHCNNHYCESLFLHSYLKSSKRVGEYIVKNKKQIKLFGSQTYTNKNPDLYIQKLKDYPDIADILSHNIFRTSHFNPECYNKLKENSPKHEVKVKEYKDFIKENNKIVGTVTYKVIEDQVDPVDLTPIPSKSRKMMKNNIEKKEFLEVERNAVSMRRVEYTHNLYNKKVYITNEIHKFAQDGLRDKIKQQIENKEKKKLQNLEKQKQQEQVDFENMDQLKNILLNPKLGTIKINENSKDTLRSDKTGGSKSGFNVTNKSKFNEPNKNLKNKPKVKGDYHFDNILTEDTTNQAHVKINQNYVGKKNPNKQDYLNNKSNGVTKDFNNNNDLDNNDEEYINEVDLYSESLMGFIQRVILIQRTFRRYLLIKDFSAQFIQKHIRGYLMRKRLDKYLFALKIMKQQFDFLTKLLLKNLKRSFLYKLSSHRGIPYILGLIVNLQRAVKIFLQKRQIERENENNNGMNYSFVDEENNNLNNSNDNQNLSKNEDNSNHIVNDSLVNYDSNNDEENIYKMYNNPRENELEQEEFPHLLQYSSTYYKELNKPSLLIKIMKIRNSDKTIANKKAELIQAHYKRIKLQPIVKRIIEEDKKTILLKQKLQNQKETEERLKQQEDLRKEVERRNKGRQIYINLRPVRFNKINLTRQLKSDFINAKATLITSSLKDYHNKLNQEKKKQEALEKELLLRTRNSKCSFLRKENCPVSYLVTKNSQLNQYLNKIVLIQNKQRLGIAIKNNKIQKKTKLDEFKYESSSHFYCNNKDRKEDFTNTNDCDLSPKKNDSLYKEVEQKKTYKDEELTIYRNIENLMFSENIENKNCDYINTETDKLDSRRTYQDEYLTITSNINNLRELKASNKDFSCINTSTDYTTSCSHFNIPSKLKNKISKYDITHSILDISVIKENSNRVASINKHNIIKTNESIFNKQFKTSNKKQLSNKKKIISNYLSFRSKNSIIKDKKLVKAFSISKISTLRNILSDKQKVVSFFIKTYLHSMRNKNSKPNIFNLEKINIKPFVMAKLIKRNNLSSYDEKKLVKTQSYLRNKLNSNNKRKPFFIQHCEPALFNKINKLCKRKFDILIKIPKLIGSLITKQSYVYSIKERDLNSNLRSITEMEDIIYRNKDIKRDLLKIKKDTIRNKKYIIENPCKSANKAAHIIQKAFTSYYKQIIKNKNNEDDDFDEDECTMSERYTYTNNQSKQKIQKNKANLNNKKESSSRIKLDKPMLHLIKKPLLDQNLNTFCSKRIVPYNKNLNWNTFLITNAIRKFKIRSIRKKSLHQIFTNNENKLLSCKFKKYAGIISKYSIIDSFKMHIINFQIINFLRKLKATGELRKKLILTFERINEKNSLSKLRNSIKLWKTVTQKLRKVELFNKHKNNALEYYFLNQLKKNASLRTKINKKISHILRINSLKEYYLRWRNITKMNSNKDNIDENLKQLQLHSFVYALNKQTSLNLFRKFILKSTLRNECKDKFNVLSFFCENIMKRKAFSKFVENKIHLESEYQDTCKILDKQIYKVNLTVTKFKKDKSKLNNESFAYNKPVIESLNYSLDYIQKSNVKYAFIQIKKFSDDKIYEINKSRAAKILLKSLFTNYYKKHIYELNEISKELSHKLKNNQKENTKVTNKPYEIISNVNRYEEHNKVEEEERKRQNNFKFKINISKKDSEKTDFSELDFFSTYVKKGDKSKKREKKIHYLYEGMVNSFANSRTSFMKAKKQSDKSLVLIEVIKKTNFNVDSKRKKFITSTYIRDDDLVESRNKSHNDTISVISRQIDDNRLTYNPAMKSTFYNILKNDKDISLEKEPYNAEILTKKFNYNKNKNLDDNDISRIKEDNESHIDEEDKKLDKLLFKGYMNTEYDLGKKSKSMVKFMPMRIKKKAKEETILIRDLNNRDMYKL